MELYDLLKETMKVERRAFLSNPFSDKLKETLDADDEKLTYELLKNICNIAMVVSDDGVTFQPSIIMRNKRSYSLEDMTEEDYRRLESLEIYKLPVHIRARVADILWTQKRIYKYANIAAEAYIELFNLLFSEDDWLESLDVIKRAICIYVQTNNKERDNCYQLIYNHLVRIDGKDEYFLSLKLIEILLFQSFDNLDVIIGILDKIISRNQDNPNKIEHAYELKFKCINKREGLEKARQVNIDLADYFVSFAERLFVSQEQGALRSEIYLKKAIYLYRNNGQPSKGEVTHRRLIEVQKEKIKYMHAYEQMIDVSKVIQNVKNNMEGLSFEESIIRIMQLTKFYTKDEVKKRVLEEKNSFFLARYFPKSIVNEEGQTILELPPLDLENPSENTELLDLHIHNKMLELQTYGGDWYLAFVLSYIQSNFDIYNESLEFIIKDNIIIPEGRKRVITFGIRLALQGEYYEALHILAPQIENIFKNIAKAAGAVTVTLEKDGTSKDKLLSSIFDLHELIDCYDNDILFLFKGLLNEQAGANIRNNIAHGIMSESNGSHGSSLYFICAVIKLFAISSPRCWEILNDMREMKPCTPIEEGALKIVKDSENCNIEET